MDESRWNDTELGSLAAIIASLSVAVDLAEGNDDNHTLRTCILGMRIGRRISLAPSVLSDLYYALLLKDIGNPFTQTGDREATGQDGVAVRRLLREGRGGMSWREAVRTTLDLHRAEALAMRTGKQIGFLWKRRKLQAESVRVRCAAAADLLDRLGVSTGTRTAVCAIDERWDGLGLPDRAQSTLIPVIAQIVKLAQTMARFHAQGSSESVIPWIHGRCRGWFDPGLVAAATRLFESSSSWSEMEQRDLLAYTVTLEPQECMLAANTQTIDRVCEVFAKIADARTTYGKTHSTQVAEIAVGIARSLKMNEQQIRTLRRAALLHEIGRLAVPRETLEKKGPLSADDLSVVRTYPLRTGAILQRIPEFFEVAPLAMMQHERLDGSGFPRHFTADKLSLSARILAVADIAEALASERSYRRKYSGQQIYRILMGQTPHLLDVRCVHAFLQSSPAFHVA
jgi:HD-GYP domain-containing protein (c-di-GMP phosphodiesterase class II)